MRRSWDWITTDNIVSLFLPSHWSDKSIKTKQTTHAHMAIAYPPPPDSRGVRGRGITFHLKIRLLMLQMNDEWLKYLQFPRKHKQAALPSLRQSIPRH